MKLFARALKEAWRHWFKLSLAFGCSLLAAALWGANIGAIFPLIETTLKGESLQDWNQERIAQDRTEIDSLQLQIAELDKEGRGGPGRRFEPGGTASRSAPRQVAGGKSHAPLQSAFAAVVGTIPAIQTVFNGRAHRVVGVARHDAEKHSLDHRHGTGQWCVAIDCSRHANADL